ncbi:hypothetical protein OAF74_02230 [bacterium]|nr:hypothetical protein [bacterium]
METKPDSNIIFPTQSATANYFGINRRTFADWLAQGCPGKPKRYDLQELCQWIVKQRRYDGW